MIRAPASTWRPLPPTLLNATRLRWMALGGLLLARLVLSVDMISRPGLQQDETLFVNAATLRIPGQNITHAIGGIPLMIFSYTGALKPWLYTPVFGVFGTSPASIRLPVVLLTMAALLLAYVAVRDLVNRPVAMLALVALCFDNSVFWLTRDDVGPSAIEFFLKCGALFCAARFARDRRPRWVVMLLATLTLGVFNKLNFIWVVNAALALSVIVAVVHRAEIRAHMRSLAVWVAGLAVLYAAFALYYFGEHIASTEPTIHGSLLSFTWPQFDLGTRAVLSGTWFYDYALAPLGPRNLVVALVLGAFVIGAAAAAGTRRLRKPPVAYFALTAILIAIQALFTASATAGWHYISIYPFVSIVAAYGVYVAAQTLLRRRLAMHVALTAVAAVTIAYDGLLMAKYFDDLSSREPKFSAWSPAIYQLSGELQRIKGQVFTADWGISNPLFALHQSGRYTELAFALQSGSRQSLSGVARSLATAGPSKLVVTHANQQLVFPQNNAYLFKAVGRHLHLVSTIRGPDGLPVFETFQYR